MNNIEEVKDGNQLLAIIIRHGHVANGIEFYTQDDSSLQLAAMGHSKGKIIQSHLHNSVTRSISETQEVLIIKQGKVRVDLYRADKSFFDSRTLLQNDIIFLASGGHGFEVLEDLQMIEVKQGPYLGVQDKISFDRKSE